MKRKSPGDRRESMRDKLWPGSEEWIWNVKDRDVKGYRPIPRVTPWILRLIDDLAGKSGAPSKAYFELLCRDMGEGFVEIEDPTDHAFAAGYDSARGLRTWKEHMRKLIELKFVLVRAAGNHEFGKVLILNPLAVCAMHNASGAVSEAWWTSFLSRAEAVGAEVPDGRVIAGAFI
jgi:hypothetical protein